MNYRVLLLILLFLSLLSGCGQKNDSKTSDQTQGSAVSPASNVAEVLNVTTRGEKVPNFSWKDNENRTIDFDSFRGKVTLINFWATWCGPCLKEMKIMPELKKKYGNKIVFISISVDDKIETMNVFLAKNPKYDWTFVHYGMKKKIQSDYGVKAIPSYFLIDPYGKFLQYPAERPSGDIEAVFKEIIKKGEKR